MTTLPPAASTCLPTPLGPLWLAASARGVCGAWFAGQRDCPDTRGWATRSVHPALQAASAQLDAYFAGKAVVFDVPLDLSAGTPFQQSVWQALCQLAPGEVLSYGALAARIGRPQAVRAVGSAVGRNPISVIVPCHRVLGAGDTLNGYGGGLPRKVALLALEGWICNAPHAEQATARHRVRRAGESA